MTNSTVLILNHVFNYNINSYLSLPFLPALWFSQNELMSAINLIQVLRNWCHMLDSDRKVGPCLPQRSMYFPKTKQTVNEVACSKPSFQSNNG